MRFIAQELREIMAQLGFRTLDEMVGRVDMLEPRKADRSLEGQGLRLHATSCMQPDVGPEVGRFCQIDAGSRPRQVARHHARCSRLCEPAIERGEKVIAELPIRNVNRVVGTITGSEVTKKYGAEGLPDDTIQFKFKGSAGQSFGAFMPQRHDASRSKATPTTTSARDCPAASSSCIPPRKATFASEENIIIGNVALYGATSGEVLRPRHGGRTLRGAQLAACDAVVEAVGDHGCEYMTGGRVVVLGPTGRNFAAGMSGGIAYVLDENDDFADARQHADGRARDASTTRRKPKSCAR